MKKIFWVKYFTVIELILAITILAVITGMIGVISVTFYKGYERTVKTSNRLERMMRVDALMDSWFRNAVPFTWTDSNSVAVNLFDGRSDELYFTTLRRSYDDRGALLFVHVFLEDDKLIAEYSYYPGLPEEVMEHEKNGVWERETVAENIASVSFIYADNENMQMIWQDDWDHQEKNYLPLAVQMTLEWQNGETEQWLRRTAGSGSNSTLGDSNGTTGTGANSSSGNKVSGAGEMNHSAGASDGGTGGGGTRPNFGGGTGGGSTRPNFGGSTGGGGTRPNFGGGTGGGGNRPGSANRNR